MYACLCATPIYIDMRELSCPLAPTHTQHTQSNFIVVSGDLVVTDIFLHTMADMHRTKDAAVTVLLKVSHSYHPSSLTHARSLTHAHAALPPVPAFFVSEIDETHTGRGKIEKRREDNALL